MFCEDHSYQQTQNAVNLANILLNVQELGLDAASWGLFLYYNGNVLGLVPSAHHS